MISILAILAIFGILGLLMLCICTKREQYRLMKYIGYFPLPIHGMSGGTFGNGNDSDDRYERNQYRRYSRRYNFLDRQNRESE